MAKPNHPPHRLPGLLILVASLLALALSACSSGPSPATATAQAARAERMATDIARGMQGTAAARTYQATATAQYHQTLLSSAAQWPTVLQDDFSDNRYEWPTGEDSDDLAGIQWTLGQGVYRWESTAMEGFLWWVTPTMDPLDDFYLAAEVQNLAGPDNSETGLVYRLVDEQRYYLFEINNYGNFAVYYHEPDTWEFLLPYTPSPAIQVGQMNRLAVITQGARQAFFINGQFVGEVSDERSLNGIAGLAIGLGEMGDQGVWEFKNFELRKQP
jgi:hypothetical protein